MLGDIKHGEWQIKNVKKHLIGFKLTEKGNIQRVAWVLSDDEGNGGGTLEMCDSEGKNLGW